MSTDTGLTINDIVWDFCKKATDGTDVSTSGSTLIENGFGRYLLKNPNVAVDTVFRIHVLNIPTKYLNGSFDGPAAGTLSGIYAVNVQFYVTGTTTPITDVSFDVWNSDQTIKLNGKSYVSDTLGQATFLRDNGTYNIRAIKAGVTISVVSITVNGADMSVTVYGDAIVFATPPANMQTLYGNVRRLNWGLATGDIVKAQIVSKQFVSGAMIQDIKLEAVVDANSQFALTVPQLAKVRIFVPHHGVYEWEITTDAVKDAADYLD